MRDCHLEDMLLMFTSQLIHVESVGNFPFSRTFNAYGYCCHCQSTKDHNTHCLITLDIWHKIGAISVKQATIGKVFSKYLIADICTSNVKRF